MLDDEVCDVFEEVLHTFDVFVRRRLVKNEAALSIAPLLVEVFGIFRDLVFLLLAVRCWNRSTVDHVTLAGDKRYWQFLGEVVPIEAVKPVVETLEAACMVY